MNKEDFKMLEAVLKENNLVKEPQSIWNAHESGTQLINKPGTVAAKKEAKHAWVLTTRDRGENVNSNYEELLPPILFLKEVNKKQEFVDWSVHESKVVLH
jgi:hypothetical protein